MFIKAKPSTTKTPPSVSDYLENSATARRTMPITPSRLKTLFLALSLIFIVYLLLSQAPPQELIPHLSLATVSPTTRRHIIFSIASSSRSWSRRSPFVRLWYNSNTTRAFVFLDRIPTGSPSIDPSLPPVIVSGDTSRFPYTFPGGLRSAIRVARVVKEIIDRNEQDARWFVFGDDDTVFFVDNLAKTLGKYDHGQWFYIGGNSEGYLQNVKNSFEMAFGGGGFAISHSLAKVLARVLDSCLMRYPHLFGSDARIFACLAELGVGLTHEPGFHQVDLRGNILGMLSAHPLSPIVSLHHLDATDPIFPKLDKLKGLQHLFKAVHIDPDRTFQQTVCYDRSSSLTVSVSWGFVVQVIEGNKFLSDLLSLQRTFTPWMRSGNIEASRYMFNTRDYPRDPCKRPSLFFLENVLSDKNDVWSDYTRQIVQDCPGPDAMKNVEQIRVFSQKLDLDIEQIKAPRRQCCDIIPFQNKLMPFKIKIRQCAIDELISMKV